MTKSTGIVTTGVLVILLAAGAALVWPTAYRPIPLRAGPARYFAAREQRFTGRIEFLTAFGWRPVMRRPQAADPLDSLMREFGVRDTTPDEAAFRAWKADRLRATSSGIPSGP